MPAPGASADTGERSWARLAHFLGDVAFTMLDLYELLKRGDDETAILRDKKQYPAAFEGHPCESWVFLCRRRVGHRNRRARARPLGAPCLRTARDRA